MLIYFLLLLSGFLFALQFAINKYFQTYKPNGETSSIVYSLIGKVAATLVFLLLILIRNEPFFGNKYTFLVGLIQAILNLLIMVFGIKVLAIGSVSFYTIAMMIGGMTIPVIFGVFLLNDNFGFLRFLAFILIAIAVILSFIGEKKKLSFKAFILYAIIFLSNGFIGVFTALHSNLWGKDISSLTFMFNTSLVASIFYIPILLFYYFYEHKKHLIIPEKSLNIKEKIFYYSSFTIAGILNGLANYLIVIGTVNNSVGAAATYPLITGGTILFSVFISALLYREKATLKKIFGALLIVVALIIFII